MAAFEWDEANQLPMNDHDMFMKAETVRSGVVSNFDEVLKLASTRDEREAISRKIRQLEVEIQSRMRVYRQQNRAETKAYLEKLDKCEFRGIERVMKKDKKKLKEVSIDRELDRYFTALMNEKHLSRVSDASYVNFLLDQVPNNLNRMNETITTKMTAKEAEDPQIVKEIAKKKANQEKLKKAKDEREELILKIKEKFARAGDIEESIALVQDEAEAKRKQIEEAERDITTADQEISKEKFKIQEMSDFRD